MSEDRQHGSEARRDGEAARSAADVLEAKRVEKVRSHASSHRCAGTVTTEDAPEGSRAARSGAAGEAAAELEVGRGGPG